MILRPNACSVWIARSAAAVKLPTNFVAKTARSFRGERDHQDARRVGAALADQVRDARGEHRGLAAARTSDDAERAVAGGDRRLLCWREAIGHPALPPMLAGDDGAPARGSQ